MTGRKELQSCNVVVTGSSSGIGRAIALEMAAAGAHVLVHGRANEEGVRQTASECQEHGVRVKTALADLATDSGRRSLIDTAWKEFSTINVWINNAGADVLTGTGKGPKSYEGTQFQGNF